MHAGQKAPPLLAWISQQLRATLCHRITSGPLEFNRGRLDWLTDLSSEGDKWLQTCVMALQCSQPQWWVAWAFIAPAPRYLEFRQSDSRRAVGSAWCWKGSEWVCCACRVTAGIQLQRVLSLTGLLNGRGSLTPSWVAWGFQAFRFTV